MGGVHGWRRQYISRPVAAVKGKRVKPESSVTCVMRRNDEYQDAIPTGRIASFQLTGNYGVDE